ncbi:MAG: tail fiber domain-containing protein [Vicinamibacterales bacterium]
MAVAVTAAPAFALSLGTFSWQLQPYCNVVSVNVTGVAGVYTVEGFDDQCGAATRAPLTGVATPNPDGTIGFGMNLVTSPGGRGIHLEARITMGGLTGPWTDSDGNTGTFAFNQRTGGSPRPVPTGAAMIPPAFGLQADGGFLAAGAVDAGTIPASGPGTRMMWFPKRAAFRVGSTTNDSWDELNVGRHSAAFGHDTMATGDGAVAFGFQTSAGGTKSFAAGHQAKARASQSVAFGTNTLADGNESVVFGSSTYTAGQAALAGGFESEAWGARSLAFGYKAVASGDESIALGGDAAQQIGVRAAGPRSVAIGVGVVADGAYSVAIGTHAGTSAGATGSFVYADRSSATLFRSLTANEFAIRAAGGTAFYSNPDLTAGVRLAPGASAWSSLSDVNSKENFRDLDGDDLLARLAAMPIREWNYRMQDAGVRHVGPTAQDFHAAFGLGEDPLRISTIDADGIALAGVGALAREHAALEAELAVLRAELAALRELVVAAPAGGAGVR